MGLGEEEKEGGRADGLPQPFSLLVGFPAAARVGSVGGGGARWGDGELPVSPPAGRCGGESLCFGKIRRILLLLSCMMGYF